MSHINPTISAALRPFYQALGAQDPAPALPAPKLPELRRGVKRASWRPPGGALPDLVVDYLEFPAQCGRRDEIGQLMDPDYPAGVELQAVYAGALDILELLSDQVLSEIEDYLRPAGD